MKQMTPTKTSKRNCVGSILALHFNHRSDRNKKEKDKTASKSSVLMILRCFINYWTIVAIAIFTRCGASALQQPASKSTTKKLSIQGIPVHRAPLRQPQKGKLQPYCFVVSSALDLPTNRNILATQVWPSARVAAKTIEEKILADDPNLLSLFGKEENDRGQKITICELGCGPGLPSLTAAAAAAATWNRKVDFRVIATDIDEFALELVKKAAKEQCLDDILSTRQLDLIEAGSDGWIMANHNKWIEDVDLFIMSDVFESNAVSAKAAKFTQRILSSTESNHDENDGQTKRPPRKGKRMWVFSQTDRAQREIYLRELQKRSEEVEDDKSLLSLLKWSQVESYDLQDPLWLCDVDETRVDYG